MQKRPRTMIMPPPNGHRIYDRPSSSSQFSRTPSSVSPSFDPEHLSQRINYLQGMLGSFRSFDRSKNASILREFIKGNTQKLAQMLDKLNEAKDELNFAAKAKPEQLRELEDLRTINVKLQQDFQKQKQKQQTLRKKRESVMDRTAAEIQIGNMRQTVGKLKTEIDLLRGQNQELSAKLSRKNFFKEYEFVVRECQGIQKQNQKLEDYMKKWKAELVKLKD